LGIFQKLNFNICSWFIVDLGRNISSNGSNLRADESVDAVVETVIVCDKEFGDVFGHNNQKILEYLTVYMWDVNMRYKTLPSVNISFRITGIIVISVSHLQYLT